MGGIIESTVNTAQGFARNLRVYLTGRGLITLTGMIAGGLSTAGVFASAWPLALVFGGGAVLTGLIRLRDMQYNLDRMATIYRADIADQLGIDPRDVTRAHVHEMAYGNAEKGIAANPIFREEIEREWQKTWLKFATTALAAVASFGLVAWGAAHESVKALMPDGIFGNILKYGSVGIVSGTTGLILNNGLDWLVQSVTRIGAISTHDRIARLEQDVGRGRAVTREQVFALFAAANDHLAGQIEQRYGKPYDVLPIEQKHAIIKASGLEAATLHICEEINRGTMRPGALAFVLTGQRGLTRDAVVAQMPPAVAPAPSMERAPQHSFVEKLGLSSRAQASHTAREDLRAQTAALAEAMR
jgi:hypothetical protein